MPEFKVAHNYRSNRGSFTEGDVVEVDERQAEWFNHDSPGVLVDVDAPVEPEAPEAPVVEPEPAVEIAGEVGERPDDSEPGVQISGETVDGEVLPPPADTEGDVVEVDEPPSKPRGRTRKA